MQPPPRRCRPAILDSLTAAILTAAILTTGYYRCSSAQPRYLLLTTCHLPLTTCHLPLTAYYLLHTPHPSPLTPHPLPLLYHQMIFDTDKVEFKRRVDHCVIASQETVYDDQNNSPLAFHQPSVSRVIAAKSAELGTTPPHRSSPSFRP